MKKNFFLIVLLIFCFEYMFAQKDTTKRVKNYYPFGSNKWYPFKGKNRIYNEPVDTIGMQTRFVPSLIVPAALIGWGVSTIKNNGLYSSYRADEDFDVNFKNDESSIDNYLIYAPYAEFATLLLLRVRNTDDFLNTTILLLKSQILMSAIVFPLKTITKEERPYSYELGQAGVPLSERKKDKKAFASMPSGHTAEAFMAATIVYREYRSRSIWYGVGAYALATTVGFYRMINDKHWESDVFVGAGIGMLSANLAYAFHEHRWGKHEIVIFPSFNGVSKGITVSYNFNKIKKENKPFYSL